MNASWFWLRRRIAIASKFCTAREQGRQRTRQVVVVEKFTRHVVAAPFSSQPETRCDLKQTELTKYDSA